MMRADTRIGGTYRLEKLLGKGGMGEVWLARHILLDEARAIKLMLGAYLSDDLLRQRFIQGEARNALRLLPHPNMVRTYELGLHEDMPYIVMEYVEGHPLGANLLDYLKNQGALNVAKAGEVLRQIAAALDNAHRQGIIHRDLKPANILVTGRDEPLFKLTDFGLTKDLEAGIELTLSGFSMGSVHYMSPEQIEGQAERRSDLYSLGIILYELLAGRPPFVGAPASIILAHNTKTPPSLSQFSPQLPAEVENVILRALAKDPTARFATAGELSQAFDQAAQQWEQRLLSPTTAFNLKDTLTEVLPSNPVASGSPGLQKQISQLEVSAASQNFLAPKPAEAIPNNLPTPLSRFIGRERDLAQIKEALQTTRLLTLTGAGGTGKTRLALEIAHAVMAQFEDGVWLVELAALTDPNLLTQTVAGTLGLKEQSGKALLAGLIDYLRAKVVLLVLDNCEHLIGPVAQLVENLLRACPRLKVLASSRENLAISGELSWRVPSLSQPSPAEWLDPARQPPLDKLWQFEAVQLFVERAQAIQTNFKLTPQNAATLAQICYQLDGIPLALELAAARVKLLSPEQIAARLDQRFRLLAGGSRTALPRQQTLKAMIDWSYDLLSESERRLLQRFSVFAGGWTLEAAEAVCAGEGLEDFEIMELLAQLVNKSLVVVEEPEDREARYRLLETIRQYAGEKLAATPEAAQFELRHVQYFLQLAEQAEPELTGPHQLEWLSRLEQEHDNLRTALGRMNTHKGRESRRMKRENGRQKDDTKSVEVPFILHPSSFILLTAALWRFWYVRGYYSEGRKWLETALALPQDEDAPETLTARAKALNGAGVMAQTLGDYAQARLHYEASLTLCRETGDKKEQAAALNNLGNLAFLQTEYSQAGALYEEGLTLRRELGDKSGIAASLGSLGNLARLQGDYGRALKLHEESLALRRELGDKGGLANSLSSLGNVAYLQADYGRATSLYEESLGLLRELQDRQGIATLLNNLGNVAQLQADYGRAALLLNESLNLRRELGDKNGIASSLINLGKVIFRQAEYGQAALLYKESLNLRYDLGDRRGLAECLESLATLAAAQQQFEKVARLGGAAENLREVTNSSTAPAEQISFHKAITEAYTGLDPVNYDAIWAEGRALELAQIVKYALL